MVIEHPAELTREQWLEKRKHGIGGGGYGPESMENQY